MTFDPQLNCENRKLKYLSLSSRPCLDELLPSITDCIALESADSDTDAADCGIGVDTFAQYQQQVKGVFVCVLCMSELKKKGSVAQSFRL